MLEFLIFVSKMSEKYLTNLKISQNLQIIWGIRNISKKFLNISKLILTTFELMLNVNKMFFSQIWKEEFETLEIFRSWNELSNWYLQTELLWLKYRFGFVVFQYNWTGVTRAWIFIGIRFAYRFDLCD